MFDENSAETRLTLAPYEESIARFDARIAEIGEEFARELTAADKLAEQRDKEQAQQLAEVLEREKAEQQQNPQQQNQWTAPREKETTISFGEYDDEQKAWSTPTPPMGLPPIPPIPDPIPDQEPVRAAAPEPMMRFGDLEEDDTPPPPPPKPGRRRLQEEDDEDMSGQTWLK
ncbi:MAG: hypothetical protein ABW224_20510 [Kibdelosporangium sp.]